MIALLAQIADDKDLRKINKAEATAWLDMTDTTIVHPLALVIFLIAAIWLFAGPRGKMSWSVLMIACLISVAQRFSVLSLDFDFIRAIGALGLIRLLFYGELKDIRPHLADKLVVGLVVAIVFCSMAREGFNAATQKSGVSLAYFSMYWIGRSSIRSGHDLRMMMVAIGVLAIPVSIFMTIEQVTGRNNFSIFGGVSVFTAIRDGKLRAQGSFTHPIIAGVFFACFAPIAIGVILAKVRGLSALLGGWCALLLGIVVIFMTNSSTPVAGLLLGVLSWCTFKFRQNLKTYLYAIVFVMIVLHFVSTHGIHNVIFTKIDFTGSSTGMHRYLLIDGMLNHIPNWMIMGDANPGYNKSFRDVTNMYVVAALTGGMIALVLLIMLVVQGFKSVVRAVRNARSREDLMTFYGLGCTLVVISISFTAVACYGEGIINCYMVLGACISIGQLPPGTRRPQKAPPQATPYRQQAVKKQQQARPGLN